MTTPERIRELRLSRHWTLQELADRCGVTKQSVHIWETGKQNISLQNMEILCDVFNIQMDYLLCKQDITMRFLSTEELNIIDAYRHMTYDQQSLVCSMCGVKRDKLSDSQLNA